MRALALDLSMLILKEPFAGLNPENVQRDYGYEPITDEDRRKWAGENLARLLGLKLEKKAKRS